MESQSIYTVNNPYGYRLNINHPKIKELFERYKKWKGIASVYPLSDTQRFEFESYVFGILKKQSPP